MISVYWKVCIMATTSENKLGALFNRRIIFSKKWNTWSRQCVESVDKSLTDRNKSFVMDAALNISHQIRALFNGRCPPSSLKRAIFYDLMNIVTTRRCKPKFHASRNVIIHFNIKTNIYVEKMLDQYLQLYNICQKSNNAFVDAKPTIFIS